jgi:hypothetical protein
MTVGPSTDVKIKHFCWPFLEVNCTVFIAMPKSYHRIRKPHSSGQFALFITVATLGFGVLCRADDITTNDIVAIPQHVTGSGNGTLDLRMFTFSGSEIQNTSGSFNGDNGNNTLPQGGGADTLSFAESYITTAGKLKSFYNLNFAPNSIHEIVLFLDLNETGGGIPTNSLDRLNIILNPASVQGNPNPLGGDVSSASQAAIDQVFSGGVRISKLNPEPADNLPVNSQGAGFADYAIFTGIDPFSLNDSDVLLFNISMSSLNNGAEEIFLSGLYAPTDLLVPEPGAASLVALGVIGIAALRRKNAVRRSAPRV